jgi:hypothetical protein
MAFANSQNRFEPSATKESLLGDVLRLGAAAEATGLFYVTSAGVFAGSFGSSYKPAATDILVQIDADSGPLVLVYCKNSSGGTIARGKYAEWTGTIGEVEEGDGTGGIAGIALCDVPASQYAWFAAGGVVVADLDAAVTAGAPLALDAAGELTPTGADKTNTEAIAVATTVGAGLAKVLLLRSSI